MQYEVGYNELRLEHNLTTMLLKDALELGLTSASMILADKAAALRTALEKLDTKRKAA